MKIGILGAGAVGALVGGTLSKAGADVLLFDTNREHIDAIKENGLSIQVIDQKTGQTANEQVYVCAEYDPSKVRPCDLVIVLTKTFSTKSAITNAAALFNADTFVLTLQDGLNNEDTLLEFFPKNMVGVGYVTLVSNITAPGVVTARVKDDICIHFRCIEGVTNGKLKELEALLNKTRIKAEYANDTAKMIWTKVIMTVATSFTSALTGLSPAQMNCIPEGRELFSRLIRESVSVANECGMYFDPDEQVTIFLSETANRLTGFSADARALLRGELTQVESTNGAVGRIGRRYGVSTPANDMVADLVRVMQHANQLKSSLGKENDNEQ